MFSSSVQIILEMETAVFLLYSLLFGAGSLNMLWGQVTKLVPAPVFENLYLSAPVLSHLLPYNPV